MNPLLYKAHPLLNATIRLLAGGETVGFQNASALLLTYLAINLPFSMLLAHRARRSLHIRLRFSVAYLLALPGAVLYTPMVLTLLSDVVNHAFHLEDRFLLLFALLVATVLLAALFAVALRYRNGNPVGLEAGLFLALTLLLASAPYALALLALDHRFEIFHVP